MYMTFLFMKRNLFDIDTLKFCIMLILVPFYRFIQENSIFILYDISYLGFNLRVEFIFVCFDVLF